MVYASIIYFSVLVAILIGCIIVGKGTKTELGSEITGLLVMAVVVVIAYWAFLLSGRERLGLLCLGIYDVGLYFLAAMMYRYTCMFTGYAPQVKYLNFFVWLAGIIDMVAMLLNVLGEYLFVISPVYREDGSFLTWKIQYNMPYYIHIICCYTIVIFSIMTLAKKVADSLHIYRKKYMIMLCAYILIVFLRMFMYLFEWKYDWSILVIVFLGIVVSYFNNYSVPKKLLQNVLYSVAENTSSLIVCFDNYNKCTYVNEGARKLLGVEKDDLKAFEDKFVPYINICARKQVDYDITDEIFTVDGEEKTILIEYQSVIDDMNKYLGCFFKMEDRTEEISRFELEKYKATHDSLTNIYNRDAFFEVVEKCIKENPDTDYCLINTNIKEFKLVNDLFGSKTGDMILIKMAEELNTLCEGDKSVVARIYGDRFAVLIPADKFDEDKAVTGIRNVEQIMKACNYKLRIVLGVYAITDREESVQSMYDKACMAIERNKDEYINGIVYYDDSIMEKALHEKFVVSEFENAIENNEVEIYIQAQVNNEREVIGGEALVRWAHPEYGVLLPGQFIEELERTGLIYKLDMYVWELAAKKLYEWNRRGITDKYISVNISAKDFYYMDIYRAFTGLVRKYNINPHNLKLEITETVLMHDLEVHLDVLGRLRKFGFNIEIDDFGSGYSSLGMLKEIKADILKIDMVFLRETENKLRSRTILESIISMTKQLGMRVVTEGVETEEQYEGLKKMGCDYYQGYLFSKPISVDEFEEKYLY